MHGLQIGYVVGHVVHNRTCTPSSVHPRCPHTRGFPSQISPPVQRRVLFAMFAGRDQRIFGKSHSRGMSTGTGATNIPAGKFVSHATCVVPMAWQDGEEQRTSPNQRSICASFHV